MSHLIKYRQFYPKKLDFQFWRDRMVSLEVFGMRWCVVVYGPVNEKQAHAIVFQAIMHALECIQYASTREVNYKSLLEYILTLINDELIEFKEKHNIDIFQGIGIALTVVDSEGRMAYAQGGDAVVMLCHEERRRARLSEGSKDYSEYNSLEVMTETRNFGTYRRWSGFVSEEHRLHPGDVWFICTDANFQLMHDGLSDDIVASLRSGVDRYWSAIKRIYNNSGLLYAGILVSGEYMPEATTDVIGMESIRAWNNWADLENQLLKDLPPGVGLYGRTAPPDNKSNQAEETSLNYSDSLPKQDGSAVSSPPPDNSDSGDTHEPWWKGHSCATILFFLFVLSIVIRYFLVFAEGMNR